MRENLFRPQILDRARIDKLLETILETPIFYLSASMGYGKTTAVRCFLEKRTDINSIWITSMDTKGDEKWLWHKCCQAVETYNQDIANKLANLTFPSSELEMRHIIELEKSIYIEPTVVVIDDYHMVKSDIITKFIKMHAEYGNPNIHIVIISRTRPTSEFLMLNLKNQCVIMWQGELAFNKDEINELFLINHFTLKPAELDEIYRYTMGWAAPTYLLLLEYASHQNIGIISESAELLKTAVYDTLDKNVQQSLLKLAPIDKFTVELAEYITEDQSVGEILKNLLVNNCFVNLLSQTMEYQFHTLLKYSLMKEMKKAGINEKEIYEKCAQWYVKKDEPLIVIEYYSKAECYDEILMMMSEMGATEYIHVAPKLLIDTFNHMSLEQKLKYPIGYLTFIHSYLVTTRSRKAYKMLMEAKAYYEEHVEVENRNHILGEICFIGGLTQHKKMDQMNRLMMEGYEKLNNHRSLILGPDMVWTYGNIHVISLIYTQVGQLKEVLDFLLDKLNYYKQIANGCGTGAKYLVQAEYAYEIGDLEEAKVFAYKAIYKAETKKQICIILDAYFILMRISYIQGNQQINQYMKEMEQRASEKKHAMLRSAVEMIGTYIFVLSKQYEQIPEWIKDFNMKDGIEQIIRYPLIPIILGMALQHRREYIQLDVLMETCVEEYKESNYIYGMIHAYILWSIAKLKLYDEEDGVEALTEAINLAKSDHIMMPFIERIDEIREMLKMIEASEPFASEILNYGTKQSVTLEGKQEDERERKLLTEREREVMSLFIKGYKQSEIAKELQISIDTVKRHIKNVYAKLDIHSKVELIERLGKVL